MGHKFGINWGMEQGMKLFDYVINIQHFFPDAYKPPSDFFFLKRFSVTNI